MLELWWKWSDTDVFLWRDGGTNMTLRERLAAAIWRVVDWISEPNSRT
jgi:hypothetical protein